MTDIFVHSCVYELLFFTIVLLMCYAGCLLDMCLLLDSIERSTIFVYLFFGLCFCIGTSACGMWATKAAKDSSTVVVQGLATTLAVFTLVSANAVGRFFCNHFSIRRRV